MGAQPADTMMALLPPVGWADVAMKQDLSNLELRLDAKMNVLRVDLSREMRNYFFALVSAFTVLLTLATAISHLLP